MEMFHMISEKNLTPNQFYLLCCLKENTASQNINLHVDLRSLIINGFVKDISDTSGKRYELQPTAISFIEKVNGFFRLHKKKTSNQAMGKGYEDKIQDYLNVFPKMKLPSGKAARTDKKNVEVAFKWFFENHEYSWETIIQATTLYVDEYRRNNYKYMQTSQYFVRKMMSDRTWSSELANWCSNVESGDIDNEQDYFSEKVV